MGAKRTDSIRDQVAVTRLFFMVLAGNKEVGSEHMFARTTAHTMLPEPGTRAFERIFGQLNGMGYVARANRVAGVVAGR